MASEIAELARAQRAAYLGAQLQSGSFNTPPSTPVAPPPAGVAPPGVKPSSLGARPLPPPVSPEGETARRMAAQRVAGARAAGAVPTAAPALAPISAPATPATGAVARAKGFASKLNPSIKAGPLVKGAVALGVPMAAAAGINTQAQREVSDIETRGGFALSSFADFGDTLTGGRASAVGRWGANKIAGVDGASLMDAILTGAGSDQERLAPLPSTPSAAVQQAAAITQPAPAAATDATDAPVATPRSQHDRRTPMEIMANELAVNEYFDQRRGVLGASGRGELGAEVKTNKALQEISAASLPRINAGNALARALPDQEIAREAAEESLTQSKNLGALYQRATTGATAPGSATAALNAITGKGAQPPKDEIEMVQGIDGSVTPYLKQPSIGAVSKLPVSTPVYRQNGKLVTTGPDGVQRELTAAEAARLGAK